jgi:hypothetical protein
VASPNVNVLLQGILTASDNTQSPAPYISNIDFQNPSMLSSQYFSDAFFPAATTGSSVPIGTGTTGPAYCIIVINRHATAYVQISVQPNGGSLAIVGTIGPQGVFVLFDPAQNGSNGYNALTLTGLTTTVPCTVFTANAG